MSTFTFTTQFSQNQGLLLHSLSSLSKTSVYFHIHCLVLSPHGSRYKAYLRQPVLSPQSEYMTEKMNVYFQIQDDLLQVCSTADTRDGVSQQGDWCQRISA